MTGVEILNQYEEMASFTILFSCFTIVAAVILLASVFCFLCVDEDKKEATIRALLMLVAVGVLVLILIAGKRDTLYEVTVSDDVSMNEFYEKYDVRKVEGKLYTVTEKDEK